MNASISPLFLFTSCGGCQPCTAGFFRGNGWLNPLPVQWAVPISVGVWGPVGPKLPPDGSGRSVRGGSMRSNCRKNEAIGKLGIDKAWQFW